MLDTVLCDYDEFCSMLDEIRSVALGLRRRTCPDCFMSADFEVLKHFARTNLINNSQPESGQVTNLTPAYNYNHVISREGTNCLLVDLPGSVDMGMDCFQKYCLIS